MPHSAQLNAEPGRSLTPKAKPARQEEADGSRGPGNSLAEQTLPEACGSTQRPERALPSRRHKRRPCQQVSKLSQAPAPRLPTPVPLPHEDAGGAVSRFSGGKGEAGSPNTAKGPGGGGPRVTWDPSPGAASASTQRLPLPRPVAITSSCVSSSPTSALATSAAAAAAASSPGALIPAPARHFRLCVLLRVRSREAPPPRRPRACAGGGAATSRARALPRRSLAQSRCGPDDAASALLCSLNVASRRCDCRVESSPPPSCAASVFVFEPLSPCSSSAAGRGTQAPRVPTQVALPWNLRRKPTGEC